MHPDLELAFRLADRADAATMQTWTPSGVPAEPKSDGTPVTIADLAAEKAIMDELVSAGVSDGILGEEIGEHDGSTNRRWIIDGIDWTRSYAAGKATWGTLIALQHDQEIVLGLASSPAQDRRWWATRGRGAFTGKLDGSEATPITVSTNTEVIAGRLALLPTYSALSEDQQQLIVDLVGAPPPAIWPWCHQTRVAEGEIDMAIWFAGDIWDHAAPSLIVEEAGGRFTDHGGANRLDSRTALYTNGRNHDDILRAIQRSHQELEGGAH